MTENDTKTRINENKDGTYDGTLFIKPSSMTPLLILLNNSYSAWTSLTLTIKQIIDKSRTTQKKQKWIQITKWQS